MNKKALEKVLKISEAFFGTQTDPEQMPVNQESRDKLHSISPDTIIYKFDGEENPIGWSVVIPTSTEVMRKFIHKEITEKELLNRAAVEKKFEALYLCTAFVVPEHRRKGHAKKLLIEAISKLSQDKNLPLYCWIYSEDGKKLVEAISKDLGKTIASREPN